jgi:hypothetical protein
MFKIIKNFPKPDFIVLSVNYQIHVKISLMSFINSFLENSKIFNEFILN